ncbi:arginase [Arctopsyche grandis]|uniref:arginase n=1 Tax=Arctopsyche grandis TaxID=121162 RepID=UPI00406D667C
MLKTFYRHFSKVVKDSRKIGIVGVPFEKGQKKVGVSLAPKRIRDSGLISQLMDIEGIDIKDYGDVEAQQVPQGHVENMLELAHVSACTKELSKMVTTVLNDGRMCVTIGGDHSIGIGTVDGHYNNDENVVVLWVDAHADLNTNKTSESGSVHGMPVALLVKELSDYWPYLPTMDWQIPKFSIRNLAYIGLRSVDKYERLTIDKYGIPAYTMEDIQRFGIDNVIKMVLQYLDPKGVKPIHVSFDIDSLDALEAPSTGTCVRGGLTLREGIYLMEQIYSTGRLKAIDLVEVNPLIGTEKDVNHTIDAAIAILKASLGYSRRGVLLEGVEDLPLQTFHNK